MHRCYYFMCMYCGCVQRIHKSLVEVAHFNCTIMITSRSTVRRGRRYLSKTMGGVDLQQLAARALHLDNRWLLLPN